MKIKNSLIAPVAIAMIAPAATAAEINLNGVNQYSSCRTGNKCHSVF
jgi:hypothetical protein